MTKSVFQIDENALEKEWVDQAENRESYGRDWAKAKRKHEHKKNEKSVVEAEMARKIRLSPKTYELEKVTEKSLEHAITLTAEYQRVAREVIEAEYEMNILKAGVDALEHKKKALEALTFNSRQEYYSAPNMREAKDQVEMERRKKLYGNG